MGQRLVIVLKKDNKNVASCYWHWSGYSDSSIEITKNVMDAAKEQQQDYLEIFRRVHKDIKTSLDVGANRNIGLFDSDNEGIKLSIRGSEQLIYIDLDTMLIDFKKAFSIENKQDAIDCENFTEENYDAEILKYEDVTDKYLVPFTYEVLLELEKDFKDHHSQEKKWKTKDSIVLFVE